MPRRKNIDWNSQPLGEMPDAVIARRLGVTAGCVQINRNKKGIPTHRSHGKINWAKQPLGEMPDSAIAKNLRINQATVSRKRKELGIRVYKKPSKIDWDKQPLGKIIDRDLAKKLKTHRTIVGRERRARGIKACRKRHPRENRLLKDINWNEQPLGRISDPELARRLGIPKTAVRHARIEKGIPPCRPRRKPRLDIDWNRQPLGKIADKDIAEKLGVHRSTIAQERLKRDISPFIEGAKKHRKNINWNKEPLGKTPDYAIAKRYKVTVDCVRRQREKLGIPPYARKDVDWNRQPLGEIDDCILASRLGVTTATIASRRLERGINDLDPMEGFFVDPESASTERAKNDTEKQPQISIVDPEEHTPKDFEVTVKIRNNHLKQRRTELGYTSQTQFAQIAGVSPSTYNGLENLRLSPINTKGDWRAIARQLANFYNCPVDELFPASILLVHKKEATFLTDFDDLYPLLTSHQEKLLTSPDNLYDDKELKKQLEQAVKTLTPKEQEVLQLRFGLCGKDEHTLTEVGDIFGVNRERIRQIQETALRKLRHGSRSKNLVDYAEGYGFRED